MKPSISHSSRRWYDRAHHSRALAAHITKDKQTFQHWFKALRCCLPLKFAPLTSCLTIFMVVILVGKWYQVTTQNLRTSCFPLCYITQELELPVASLCGCPHRWHFSKHSPDLSCPQGISNLCGLCLWIMKYIVIPQIKHIKLNDCLSLSFSLCELLTMYHCPWHFQYHKLTLNSEKLILSHSSISSILKNLFLYSPSRSLTPGC